MCDPLPSSVIYRACKHKLKTRIKSTKRVVDLWNSVILLSVLHLPLRGRTKKLSLPLFGHEMIAKTSLASSSLGLFGLVMRFAISNPNTLRNKSKNDARYGMVNDSTCLSKKAPLLTG